MEIQDDFSMRQKEMETKGESITGKFRFVLLYCIDLNKHYTSTYEPRSVYVVYKY